MSKKLLLLFLSLVMLGILISGCEEEVPPQYITMRWGIPEEIEGFPGLKRQPQGLEVEHVGEDTLQVLWQTGESYILPISATADQALEGVRYRGQNIPTHLELEWLDPWEEEWYPVEAVPEDRIKAVIEKENGLFTIDFGPPEGADFEEGMNRVIWFRITPTEPAEFAFNIFGYLPDNNGEPSANRVSNILTLQAEVE